ncbi:MAG TPA: diguanylate cyclase [Gemmatimonadales bacterium]|nr:diguanylate cyclase [Gemmatimonadales bacterium]
MQPGELLDFLQHAGRDPSRLIFEDELTGVHNRRFLHSYLEHKVHWKSGTDYPLSLLILDLDRFKDLNDTHGHATGDQLLTWVASVLRDVSGEQGLPVRFGGDEFIVLLPKTDDRGAREMASRLLQRVNDRPFRLRDAGVAVPVTLSIGIATAPADGSTGRALLQAADTALYHAKQSGRNQAATAAEVDPKKVFPRTALHRLLASGIAGRDAELGALSEALIGLSRGQNRFLLFEGAPGMGKSTLLDTIGRNLSGDAGFAVAQVAGDAREGYRPYVVATRLLVALLNRREDKGATLVQSLGSDELAHLSQIVPQVGETAAAPAADESARRQGIFAALGRFLPRVVEGHPLVVILDDLHLADEASLLLLRALMQSGKLPMLVCGATLEPLSLGREEQSPPIERFYAARGRELAIQRLKLGGLSAEHIAEYLRSVFPNLQMPEGFEGELGQLTQGNPLFLGEVIRKLVADRKVTLVGQEWTIAPIEPGYLPRSLEEIVRQKITALDAESRYLLEQASALGEDVPLSVLTGSSQLDENQVLEFLDRAEALGLVSLDFQRNDDVMRFLGKRVLEISYGAIDERRRQTLHEQVGAYHEALHGQRFLPSASLLAYHFKRSANLEKAQVYERAQRVDAQSLFDAVEAAGYTTQLLEDEVDPEGRLKPDSVALVPAVGRALVMAVRSIQLYPPESKAIPQAQQQLQQSLAEVLAKNAWLELSQDRRTLLANGQRLDLSEWNALAEALVEVFDRFELQSLTFHRGVTDVELRTILQALATTKPESIGPTFWKTLLVERGLTRVQAQQVRYAKVVRVRAGSAAQPAAREEEPLDPQDLALVPKILRALQSAGKAAKLYPVESEHVTRAVEQFRASIQDVLGRRGTFTLARAEHALLGNGTRLDTSAYEAVANQVVELLDSAGLESLTVFAGVQGSEIAVFLGGLRDLPPGVDGQFWDELARDKGLTGLAFNHRKYARNVVHGLLAGPEADEPSEAERDAAAVDRLSEEPMEALRRALPQFGKELLVKGEHALMRRLLHRQFHDFQTHDATARAKSVQACSALMQRLILGLQHKFAQLAAEFLLPSLGTETEPQVLRELADVLYSMASTSVQFADYQLAGRVLQDLRARQDQLRGSAGRDGAGLAALLDRKLDAAALKLLDEDLRSGQPDRHERAAEVLGALGPAATPLLIEVIKQENDFRIRQLAARLVAETGPQAAEAVKRALVTEVIVEQRAHMLEVIDVVTKDLRLELEQCLRDANPKVRRAAFQLFERLGQDELVPLVAPFARHSDPAVARGAIRALTALRSPAAVRALASILDTAKDEGLVALVCQALGLSEQATAIDALARVLAERRVFFFGRRWGPDVRRTAALALKQIPHPSVAEVLARYLNDSDAEVQQVARGRAERASRPVRASGALRAIADLPPET